MSGTFGYPFQNVEDKKKEATVGSGTVLTINPDSDLVINKSFNYSNVFESSWKRIILGDTYKASKRVTLTVRSWTAKRWILNRNKFRDFDANTYYAIEGISADSLRVTCKLTLDASADSKAIEAIVKQYLKTNTVAFAIVDGLKPSSSNSAGKGLVQLAKKDSSEFTIIVKDPTILYAVKFGKSKVSNNDYFVVQDSYAVETKITLGNETRKTLLNYAYKLGAGAGVVNIYADFVRVNLTDKSPKLRIYNGSSNETFALVEGNDIGNGMLRYDGEAVYQRAYSGNKLLKVNVAYNFDFNPTKKLVILRGVSDGEFQNCIYEINSKFFIYP